MLARYTIAALAGSALLATSAFAQTATTPADTAPKAAPATAAPTPATASDMTSSYKGTWRTSKLVGLNVYNDSNESIGSINDLLADTSGDIKAVVIGVGGFLGIGEHLVAVPMDKVKFVNEPVAYTGASNTSGGATKTATTTTTTTGAATAPASKPNPWYPDHAVFSATKEQLKAMSEFKYATE